MRVPSISAFSHLFFSYFLFIYFFSVSSCFFFFFSGSITWKVFRIILLVLEKEIDFSLCTLVICKVYSSTHIFYRFPRFFSRCWLRFVYPAELADNCHIWSILHFREIKTTSCDRILTRCLLCVSFAPSSKFVQIK